MKQGENLLELKQFLDEMSRYIKQSVPLEKLKEIITLRDFKDRESYQKFLTDYCEGGLLGNCMDYYLDLTIHINRFSPYELQQLYPKNWTEYDKFTLRQTLIQIYQEKSGIEYVEEVQKYLLLIEERFCDNPTLNHKTISSIFIQMVDKVGEYVCRKNKKEKYLIKHQDFIFVLKNKNLLKPMSELKETQDSTNQKIKESNMLGTKQSIKFCPECGTKRLTETSKFCSECGFEFSGLMGPTLTRSKIHTYLKGLDYPLEEIPAFHHICKELKLRKSFEDINLKRILPLELPGLMKQPDYVIKRNKLREIIFKDMYTIANFKEFMLTYIGENVNVDGTIKTWESGLEVKQSTISKSEILKVVETAIDLTSPRGVAKRIIKMLKD